MFTYPNILHFGLSGLFPDLLKLFSYEISENFVNTRTAIPFHFISHPSNCKTVYSDIWVFVSLLCMLSPPDWLAVCSVHPDWPCIYEYLSHPYVCCIQIDSLCAQYILHNDTYRRLSATLLQEMEKGLGAKTNTSANIKMFPTYVRSVPDGTGTGSEFIWWSWMHIKHFGRIRFDHPNNSNIFYCYSAISLLETGVTPTYMYSLIYNELKIESAQYRIFSFKLSRTHLLYIYLRL